MGSQGIGESRQSQLQPLSQQNSMYNLTLDEVQSQLGDSGKSSNSMNLQELLKSVWTTEVNQSIDMDIEKCSIKRTSEENPVEMTVREKQPNSREVTLEDFLLKEGIVEEGSLENPSSPSQISQHAQWLQYQQPQLQHPQQNIMSVYLQAQALPQPLPVVGNSVISYPESQVTSGRKRSTSEQVVDKSVERRHKRMIKNRESAARSRARKQAYTTELEYKVSRLEEENERLRRQQELEKMLPCEPLPEPKYQLRRTSSSSF